MARIKGILKSIGGYSAIVVSCVSFVAFMSPVSVRGGDGPSVVFRDAPEVIEAPDSLVGAAVLAASLVQQGPMTPFTGNGIPGIVLTVKSRDIASALNWTIEGWANQTSSAPGPVCKHGYHFASSDWIGVTAFSDSEKTYVTIGASPLRMMPDGDQCPAHLLAFGTWQVQVRIDHRSGGPLPDGDSWDRGETWKFQVPA